MISEKRLGAVPRVRLWDATKINKESRSVEGEGDGEVSLRARQREMKVGTLSHSCQQFLMQTLLLIGRANQVVPPNFTSSLSGGWIVWYEESSIRFENLFQLELESEHKSFI